MGGGEEVNLKGWEGFGVMKRGGTGAPHKLGAMSSDLEAS